MISWLFGMHLKNQAGIDQQIKTVGYIVCVNRIIPMN